MPTTTAMSILNSNDVLHGGVLYKRDRNGRWGKRFFCLLKNELCYHTSAKKALGADRRSYDPRDVTSISVSKDPSNDNRQIITLTLGNGEQAPLQLRAPTAQEHQAWRQAFDKYLPCGRLMVSNSKLNELIDAMPTPKIRAETFEDDTDLDVGLSRSASRASIAGLSRSASRASMAPSSPMNESSPSIPNVTDGTASVRSLQQRRAAANMAPLVIVPVSNGTVSHAATSADQRPSILQRARSASNAALSPWAPAGLSPSPATAPASPAGGMPTPSPQPSPRYERPLTSAEDAFRASGLNTDQLRSGMALLRPASIYVSNPAGQAAHHGSQQQLHFVSARVPSPRVPVTPPSTADEVLANLTSSMASLSTASHASLASSQSSIHSGAPSPTHAAAPAPNGLVMSASVPSLALGGGGGSGSSSPTRPSAAAYPQTQPRPLQRSGSAMLLAASSPSLGGSSSSGSLSGSPSGSLSGSPPPRQQPATMSPARSRALLRGGSVGSGTLVDRVNNVRLNTKMDTSCQFIMSNMDAMEALVEDFSELRNVITQVSQIANELRPVVLERLAAAASASNDQAARALKDAFNGFSGAIADLLNQTNALMAAASSAATRANAAQIPTEAALANDAMVARAKEAMIASARQVDAHSGNLRQTFALATPQ